MRFWYRRPFASPSPIRPKANLTTIQIDNAPAQGLEASSLDEKLERLDEILGSMGGTVLIGYSGGVDSAMLAVAAHRVLGKRAIAVTADSESYADGELETIRIFANPVPVIVPPLSRVIGKCIVIIDDPVIVVISIQPVTISVLVEVKWKR